MNAECTRKTARYLCVPYLTALEVYSRQGAISLT